MKWVGIGSINVLSPIRRQSIIQTNAALTSIGHLVANFSDILINIRTFSFKKMHLKILFKIFSRPQCVNMVCACICVCYVKVNNTHTHPHTHTRHAVWRLKHSPTAILLEVSSAILNEDIWFPISHKSIHRRRHYGFCFHHYCADYDECKYSDTFCLQIVFVCLYITPSHYHHCANLSEDIELMKCLSDIFCPVCE